MGRLALMIVLALSMTVGIVGYNLNKSKNGLVENVSGFDKYANARNIAHTGVNMMLRKLDRNDSATIAQMNAGQTPMFVSNVASGICSVSIKLTNPAYKDTVDIWAKSRFMDTTRTMTLRLRRQPVPFPVANEAASLGMQNVNFNMQGSSAIDGHNHDINGNLLPPSAKDVPGVGVVTPADTQKVLLDANKIDGTRDCVVDSGMSDPSQYVDEYINAADRIYTAGSYGSNYTWGSVNTPWIVYCSGSVTFQGNIEGWGIFVIHGDLTLAGTFKFHGLVICYDDVQIDVQLATGTPDVIGAVICAGSTGSKFVMKGNSNISYSTDALDKAKYINKLQVYRVMYWYE